MEAVRTRVPADRAVLTRRAQRLHPSRNTAQRAPVRLPPELSQGFEREFRASMRMTNTPREQAAATLTDFAHHFGDLARDEKAFHAMMKKVFGKGYNRALAEDYRTRALQGDFSWMPPVKFVDRGTLQGAHGAYDSDANVVYLSKDLLAQPALATQVYAEEFGHFLDAKLNRTDSAGDEGELFRRLLAGENLSQAQIEAIRAENDHGVIVVDGKRVEVEFWNPFKAIKKAFKKVGKAFKKVGKAIATGVKRVFSAGKTLVENVFNAAVGLARAPFDWAAGFAKDTWRAIKGEVSWGEAWKNLGKGMIGDPVDAILGVLGGVVSAVGTIAGTESTGRKLTTEERIMLERALGDSVDLDKVVIKSSDWMTWAGPGKPHRAKVVGNTIYMDPADFNPDGTLNAEGMETLAHEIGHIWQFQNGGDDYIHDALLAQAAEATGGAPAYDFTHWAGQGVVFEDLNAEAQADVIREVVENYVALRTEEYPDIRYRGRRLSREEIEYLRRAIPLIQRGVGAP